MAVALVGGIAIGVATGAMAEILDGTRLWLSERGGSLLIPDALGDAERLKGTLAQWLRAHAAELRKAGGELGRALVHAAVGMAVGLLIFFRTPPPSTGPLAEALAEPGRRLADAFEAVVFAQVKISAINTGLTALYLLVILRLAGVHMPFGGTLVAVTFLTGLLPVVGNLLSNTVIVVISLEVSPWVAAASLVFLVVIHKLEYFINARIVGGEIQAAAWEVLVALLVFETTFGVTGLILAPIIYAYAKQELVDRGLI